MSEPENPSAEVLAERARCYELAQVLLWGTHREALAQALKAIQHGRSRAEMAAAFGPPWSVGPTGAKHNP